MTQSAGDLISHLYSFSSQKRKEKNEYFFKTGKAGYAENDVFVGVSMPHIRAVAKDFQTLPLSEIKKLLYNEVHELRLCALVILVLRYKAGPKNKCQEIVDFYLQHKAQANNWDLVDVSTHYILGQAIIDGLVEKKILHQLIASEVLWDRRIAMVSTWIMIRSGDTDTVLALAEKLLDDHEDLIHKAVGWMLREAWKREPGKIEDFLIQHYNRLPRTTLRYAIEKMEPAKRKLFLAGVF